MNQITLIPGHLYSLKENTQFFFVNLNKWRYIKKDAIIMHIKYVVSLPNTSDKPQPKRECHMFIHEFNLLRAVIYDNISTLSPLLETTKTSGAHKL